MEQLLTKVADIAPVVAILVYFIWYFKGELKAKNDEIKELNTLLRSTQQETISTISQMTNAVEHLTELIKQKL